MGIFSDAQGQLTLAIKLKFELVRDFIVVLLICKNEKDSIKNEGARVLTRFHPLNPIGAIRCYENQSFDPI